MRETGISGGSRALEIDVRSDLRRALLDARTHSSRRRRAFRRIIIRMPAVDPLRWIGGLDHPHRFFWSGRDRADILAGVGRAAAIESAGGLDYDAMRGQLLRNLSVAPSGTRFFGGISFDPARQPESEWKAFPAYRFVLPRFEMRSVERSTLVICNVGPGDDYDMLIDELDRLEAPPERPPSQVAGLAARSNHPSKGDWDHAVDWALSAFSCTTLAKVVLGRKARLHFTGALDPFDLLGRLVPITPDCYHFIFFDSGAAFLGASPEMLFQRDGSAIRSEAVAGTALRGGTEGVDRQLRENLLQSEKDQREHEYVRQCIKEVLTDLTRVLHVDTTASDMKLARGRHLRSGVEGVLNEGVDAVDLLRALHPTPAVGGHPQEEAMDVIRHLEPFDRGWYAGPIGWIGDGAAEFAVAIRSGLCRGRVLDLYSGAGIVCGSNANMEWDEVEQKIGDFLKALGLDNGR